MQSKLATKIILSCFPYSKVITKVKFSFLRILNIEDTLLTNNASKV